MTPRRRFSTLNELANKSPNNPLAGIKRAERINSSLLSKDVESESVENISPDLGDIVAGRIISVNPISTSSEPTESGFTGAFHSGKGEQFAEGNVIIGGVEAGVLNAGITDAGRLIINSVTLNGTELDAGITRTEAGWITQQTVTVGSEVRVMRMGMESNGTEAEGVIEYNQPGSSVSIPNGDFASLDLTSWTQTAGTWTAAAGWAVGSISGMSAPELTNAARFAVTAASTYNFHVNTAGTFLDPSGSVDGTITVQIKFYTAITGGSLVSTETVGTRTGSSLGWAAIERNITVPATATHAVFVAKCTLHSQSLLQLDDFTVVESTTSRLTMRDGGLFYTPMGGTEFEIEKPLEYLIPKTANESFGNTTPTNVTDLLWTIPANTIQWFNLTVKITTATAGGTMDARLLFTLPSGAAITWGSLAGTVSDMEVVNSTTTPNSVSTGTLTIGLDSNATSIFRFGGFITTSSTAGTVQLQARQDTSNANTFQIDKASFIRYTDLSGANLASPAYYTDAEAQDAVGAILLDTATIDFVYTANTSIEASVKSGSITEAMLEMPTAASTSKVIGWTGTVLDWITLSASYISDFVAEVLSATSAVYAPIAKGVTNGDSHDHSGGDGAQISFLSLGGAPASYIASNMVQVNSAGTALELIALGAKIHSTTNKTLPVDADEIVLSNSAVSFASAARTTLTNFKAYLKTYNDTLYQAVGSYLTDAPSDGSTYGRNNGAWSVVAGGGDISGTGVVGQLAEFVTNTKTLQAAKLIAPPTHILTLTTTAASTLALNITAAKTLTLTAADNYTLTIPATGTAALGTGTANQIAYWSGTNTLTGSAVYTISTTEVADTKTLVINGYNTAYAALKLIGVNSGAQTYLLMHSGGSEAYFKFSGSNAFSFRGPVVSFVDVNNTNISAMFYPNVGNIFTLGHTTATVPTPSVALEANRRLSTNNAITEVGRLSAIVSSGGSAAGFGVAQTFWAETATDGTSKQQGRLWSKYIVATNGSETSAVGLDAYTNSTAQEFISGEGNSGGVKLALYGGTRVARGAALTAADSGTINSGDATTDAVIANMRTRINELEARLGSATGINAFA